MYCPEKGHYENESVFKTVEPFQLISWTRISKPIFDMEVGFEKRSDSKTKISFRMIFETAEEYDEIIAFTAIQLLFEQSPIPAQTTLPS